MRLSYAAANFGDGRLPVTFLGVGDLGRFIREKGLSTANGFALSVPGEHVRAAVRGETMYEIEQRSNALLVALRASFQKNEDVLEQTLALVDSTRDPYELHYMASMFLHQRAVMRALAKHPQLSEKTQLQIAMDGDLNQDREILLGLAHNTALTSQSMRMVLSKTQDARIWQGVARNAAFQARRLAAPMEFTTLCEDLSESIDDGVATAAISGIKSAELLRGLYQRNNSLLSPERLEKIAENPNTPDDVLEKMSTSAFTGVQRLVGMTFPEQARMTLATRRQQSSQAAPAPSL